MTATTLKGVWTALSTPFLKGGDNLSLAQAELDKKSFKKLIEFQLKQGVDGFVVNGTTAESPTLLKPEIEKLFEWSFDYAKKKPIIMGVGGNSTHTTCHNVRWASKLGAHAFLAVVPYYNKPPQRGLIRHFKSLADMGRDIILYNVPARTGQSLSLESILTLSQHPNIIGIKEASGDLKLGEQIIQQTNPKEFSVLSGDDETGFKLCALGAKGIISVVSHIIGKEMKALLKQINTSPKRDEKQKICQQYKATYSALLKALYAETNPIGIKMALKLMGIFETAEMRLPLVEMEDQNAQTLKKALKTLKDSPKTNGV